MANVVRHLLLPLFGKVDTEFKQKYIQFARTDPGVRISFIQS